MTIQEALDIVDEMKPNMMSRKLKVKYLQEIEQLIWDEIVVNHYQKHDPPAPPEEPPWWPKPFDVWPGHPVPPETQEKPAYSEETDPGTEMIAQDPYSMVYVYWLMSKIDIQNQEDERYNIDRMRFENAYDTFSDWYTRTHMPRQRTREFRL